MKRIKLGILACSGIANKMACAAAFVDNIELYACASRELSHAKEFAAKYNIAKAYGAYEELASDEEVDLIYVSSPHSHHYENVKLCLEAGKHVVCEKPFTTDAAQAAELFKLAKSQGLFLMEALWTRFLPAVLEMKRMLDEGVIGELLTLNQTSGQDLRHVERIISPELAGGALLDMGVYSLTYADLFLGEGIKNIYSSVRMSKEGVDQTSVILLDYGDGKCASIMSSGLAAYKECAYIMGAGGYAAIEGTYGPESFTVTVKNKTTAYSYPFSLAGNGFEYELIEAVNCIQAGKPESDKLPGDKTVYMMGLLDRIRKEWGMVYPFETLR